MLKNKFLMGAALAMTATAIVPAAPAMARDGYYDYARVHDNRYYNRDYERRGYDRRYYRGDRYYGHRNHGYSYRGKRCDSGTGGTIIGAIVGGLLGNEVAGRGDKTTGVIIGGAAGALAGRAIDRSDGRRC